jgi:hypothetical protein
MDRQQAFDRFNLNDELTLHDEVEAVATRQPHAFVCNRQGLLTFEVQPMKGQLMSEKLLVCRLEQARPNRSLNLNARTDDLLRRPPKSPRLRASLFHSPLSATFHASCATARLAGNRFSCCRMAPANSSAAGSFFCSQHSESFAGAEYSSMRRYTKARAAAQARGRVRLAAGLQEAVE